MGKASADAYEVELFGQMQNNGSVHMKPPFRIYLEILFISLALSVFPLR